MKRIASLVVLVLLAGTVHADNWPQWRGPHFNGTSTETNLPAKWSATENVAWRVELPGEGAATPIIWGDHVFISSADAKADAVKAMCFNRRDGSLRWEHTINQGVRKDPRSTFASPSPATDGTRVVFFYGNGDLAAFAMDGQPIWKRNIQEEFGPFAFQWTFSSSPVLYDGRLYLQVLQRDVPAGRGFGRRPGGGPPARGQGSDAPRRSGIESFLLAMAPETGETIWRTVRPSQAVAESREAFSTPIPFEFGGRRQLLVAGGDDLTGHDLETGAELWRWGTWNPTRIGHWRLVPSPVAGDGMILVCAPKKDPVYAIKAGGTGELTDDAIAWYSEEELDLTADVPTPAFYDGDFFILSDLTRALSRVEPATGKVKWTIRTPGTKKYEASPLVADGKVYLLNFAGEAVVVNAEDGSVINDPIPMTTGEDEVRASISVSQGQLFIRTNTKLFCIGK